MNMMVQTPGKFNSINVVVMALFNCDLETVFSVDTRKAK